LQPVFPQKRSAEPENHLVPLHAILAIAQAQSITRRYPDGRTIVLLFALAPAMRL